MGNLRTFFDASISQNTKKIVPKNTVDVLSSHGFTEVEGQPNFCPFLGVFFFSCPDPLNPFLLT